MRRILFGLLICGLMSVDCGLIYGQDDYADVKGNIKAKTLTFKPSWGDTAGGLPSTPVEGELFYDYSSTGEFIKQPVYYDGSKWQAFTTSQADKFVATHIVAAPDSKDTDRADIKCDGTKPDNEFIQDAIKGLPAGIGGSVYLLDGTYTITTPIIINKSNVSLIGAGKSTVLRLNGGNKVIYVQNPATRVLIAQLVIDGNNILSEGIKLESVSYSKIDKVRVMNTQDHGICLDNSNNNTITDCLIQTITNSSSEGIHLKASSSYNIISGNHFLNNYKDILVQASKNNTIINNYIGSSTKLSVHLDNASSNIVSSNNIIASSPNSASGIGLTAGSLRNTISDNAIFSVGMSGIVLKEASNNNLISGNTIKDNCSHGILISGSLSNSVTGNVIYDLGTAYTTADGIRIEKDLSGNGSKYNLIASNYISGQPGYATNGCDVPVCVNSCWINITAGCTDNYIVDNELDEFCLVWPTMRDDGTNNAYTDKNKMSIRRWSILNVMSGTNPTINPNNPTARSYIPVAGCSVVDANGVCTTYANAVLNSTTPISAGSAPGDILILEGTRDAPGRVGIPCNSNTTKLSELYCILAGGSYYRPLGANDVLELIWNGNYWLEVMYEDN